MAAAFQARAELAALECPQASYHVNPPHPRERAGLKGLSPLTDVTSFTNEFTNKCSAPPS